MIKDNLDAIIKSLEANGLEAEWVRIESYDGLAPLGDAFAGEQYQVKVRLGESHIDGYEAWGIVTVVSPETYPSLAHIQIVELSKDGQQIAPHLPIFTPEVDRNYAAVLLPLMHKALNSLDPSGKEKGLLIQSYNNKMTLATMRNSSEYSRDLVLSFEEDGQLAQIAVDFHHFLIRLIGELMRPWMKKRKIHYLARTKEASALTIPLMLNDEKVVAMDNHSTALDEGFRIAIDIMERHYADQPKVEASAG